MKKPAKSGKIERIEFIINETPVTDFTISLNEKIKSPELPNPGGITFKGITVNNIQSDTTLPPLPEEDQLKQELNPNILETITRLSEIAKDDLNYLDLQTLVFMEIYLNQYMLIEESNLGMKLRN